jgi:hypothetical protein
MSEKIVFPALRASLAIEPRLAASAGQASTPALRIPRGTYKPGSPDYAKARPFDAAAVIKDFRQYEPREGAPVSEETEAYLSYDDDNLYAILDVKGDPGEIRA